MQINESVFESGSLPQRVARMAAPTIISQIVLVLYNLADTFFIGLTNSDARMTAVTISMPALMVLSAVANLFGIGASSVIAQSLGRKDTNDAGNAACFAFWGCLLTSLLYSVVLSLGLSRFIDLLGGKNKEVHYLTAVYLRYTVIVGGAFTAMNSFLGHLVRSEGRPMQAGFGIMLGAVCNIALDPLFMFVLLPRGSEVTSVALATLTSNVLAVCYFAVVLIRNRKDTVLRLRPGADLWKRGIPRQVLTAGFPAFTMTLFENISYAVMDCLLSAYGVAVQAGIGVAKKVNMLAHCIVRGMSQGVLPLIAYYHGAGDKKRMKQTFCVSSSVSVVLAAACTLCAYLFGRQLIGIFLADGSPSAGFGLTGLRILCLGCPFSAFAYSVISLFQAVREPRKSFVLAIMRKGILDIPLFLLLGRLFQMAGILWSTVAADVLCCGCAWILMGRFWNTDRRPIANPEQN